MPSDNPDTYPYLSPHLRELAEASDWRAMCASVPGIEIPDSDPKARLHLIATCRLVKLIAALVSNLDALAAKYDRLPIAIIGNTSEDIAPYIAYPSAVSRLLRLPRPIQFCGWNPKSPLPIVICLARGVSAITRDQLAPNSWPSIIGGFSETRLSASLQSAWLEFSGQGPSLLVDCTLGESVEVSGLPGDTRRYAWGLGPFESFPQPGPLTHIKEQIDELNRTPPDRVHPLTGSVVEVAGRPLFVCRSDGLSLDLDTGMLTWCLHVAPGLYELRLTPHPIFLPNWGHWRYIGCEAALLSQVIQRQIASEHAGSVVPARDCLRLATRSPARSIEHEGCPDRDVPADDVMPGGSALWSWDAVAFAEPSATAIRLSSISRSLN